MNIQLNTPLRNIMTRDVITVSPDTTMSTVGDIFKNRNIHHLPVVEGQQLVGILSEVDYFKVSHCIALFRSKENEKYNEQLLGSLLVSEVMTNDVVSLRADDTVSDAALLFATNRFHALPIVDNEVLVGIVSTYDLLEFAYNSPVKSTLQQLEI